MASALSPRSKASTIFLLMLSDWGTIDGDSARQRMLNLSADKDQTLEGLRTVMRELEDQMDQQRAQGSIGSDEGSSDEDEDFPRQIKKIERQLRNEGAAAGPGGDKGVASGPRDAETLERPERVRFSFGSDSLPVAVLEARCTMPFEPARVHMHAGLAPCARRFVLGAFERCDLYRAWARRWGFPLGVRIFDADELVGTGDSIDGRGEDLDGQEGVDEPAELEQLREENARLRAENEEFRRKLSEKESSTSQGR